MRAKTTVLVPERQLCSWLSTGPLTSPTVIHTNKIWPQPFYGYHGICQSRPVGALCALTYYCCDLIIVDCVKYIILDFYILNFLTIKENFSFFTNNHQCEINFLVKIWLKFKWAQISSGAMAPWLPPIPPPTMESIFKGAV